MATESIEGEVIAKFRDHVRDLYENHGKDLERLCARLESEQAKGLGVATLLSVELLVDSLSRWRTIDCHATFAADEERPDGEPAKIKVETIEVGIEAVRRNLVQIRWWLDRIPSGLRAGIEAYPSGPDAVHLVETIACFFDDDVDTAILERAAYAGHPTSIPVDADDIEPVPPQIEPMAQAIALLTQHPDWTDTKIAETVGVHRTTIYTWGPYGQLRELLKAKIPRGSRRADGQIEAADNDGELD